MGKCLGGNPRHRSAHQVPGSTNAQNLPSPSPSAPARPLDVYRRGFQLLATTISSSLATPYRTRSDAAALFAQARVGQGTKRNRGPVVLSAETLRAHGQETVMDKARKR